MNNPTPRFPEVQIADAINCEIESIIFFVDGWHCDVSGVGYTVEVSDKPLDCYFNNCGKLELVLSAISGDVVWQA